ncbi:MAG TPA: hypothetical protein VGJ26_18770 [Pirellulales bacterium]|jgi:aspartokinase-like uncharacterized kinase
MSIDGITRRVVKLGGSVLTLPDVVERFRAWLEAQSAAETLLIVGGGELADAVRKTHRFQPLSDSAAHWLCVRAMQLQAELIAGSLPEAEFATSVEALRDSPRIARLAVVDPWRFVHDEEPRLSSSPLPESWDVTSDSIAARLAQLTGACEVVLLKSALPPAGDLEELALGGYIDHYFPRAIVRVPRVRVVNLRDPATPEMIIDVSESNDRSG